MMLNPCGCRAAAGRRHSGVLKRLGLLASSADVPPAMRALAELTIEQAEQWVEHKRRERAQLEERLEAMIAVLAKKPL